MKLVNNKGEAVAPGTEITDFRGDVWTFQRVSRPPDGPSEGRVEVKAKQPGNMPVREFYPSVFPRFRIEVED